MVRYLILSLLSFVAVTATAQTRAVMETIPATRKTIVVDTTNARVDIASDTYRGPIAEVSLFVATNAVVGVGSKPVVIYGTGTVSAQKLNLPVASQCAQFDANGYLTGSGTTCANAATDFGPSTAALSIRLDAVAVSTTALSASTAALSIRLDAVAVSTTALSASTAALSIRLGDVAISTAALSLSTAANATRLTAVAVSTTALSVSTVALSVRLDSVALSTTALSASTVTLAGTLSTMGQSTNTFNVWMGTTSLWMTANNVSTTSLSASTVTIRSNQVTDEAVISALGSSTNTIRVNLTTDEAVISALGISTGSLATTKLSSPTVAGVVGNSLTIGSNGLPAWASITGGGETNTYTSSKTLTQQVQLSSGIYLATSGSTITYASSVSISTTGATYPRITLSTMDAQIQVGASSVTWTPGYSILISTMASYSPMGVLVSTFANTTATEIVDFYIPRDFFYQNGMTVKSKIVTHSVMGTGTAGAYVSICGGTLYSWWTFSPSVNDPLYATIELVRVGVDQYLLSGNINDGENHAYPFKTGIPILQCSDPHSVKIQWYTASGANGGLILDYARTWF